MVVRVSSIGSTFLLTTASGGIGREEVGSWKGDSFVAPLTGATLASVGNIFSLTIDSRVAIFSKSSTLLELDEDAAVAALDRDGDSFDLFGWMAFDADSNPNRPSTSLRSAARLSPSPSKS